MQEKNIHFNIDFKYKFEKENFNIDEVTNAGYYRSLRSAIARHYMANGKGDEFWSLITDAEVRQHRVKHYEHDSLDEATKEEIVQDFYKAVKDPNYDGYYGAGNYNHTARYLYADMQMLAASRTQEYLDAKRSFESWLNTRPGVVRVFQEYRDKENQNRETHNRKYADGSYSQKLIPDSNNIEDIGEYISSVKFRRFLENARPQRYKPGTAVKLRSAYLNKRGKDPFFYVYDKDVKNSERVGIVLKKINTTRNFGQGSREIRVMWFANGEESLLMERCLEKYDPDGKPAAAKGK